MAKPHTPTSLTEEDVARMETNIPSEMRDANNWCCYKIVKTTNGRLNKIPCDMQGKMITGFKANFSFEELASENKKITGLGFAIRPPFAAWDIDHCLDDNGRLKNKEIMDDLYKVSSYTEVSPSCTGLHVFFESEQPKWVVRQKGCDYELYYNNRFVTVTGYVGQSFNPSFRNVDEDAIKQIYSHMDPDFGREKTHEEEGEKSSSPSHRVFISKQYDGIVGSEDDIIKRLYGYRKSSKLFDGDWESVTKINGQPIESHSEADIMLTHFCAVQSKYDWELTDSVFRKSALMRDKWDEYRGEVTYGELTMLQEFESSSHRENIPEEVRRRAQ